MLGRAATRPMSCVCLVTCAAEGLPSFLILALKVVFAAFLSLGLAVQKQLLLLQAPALLPWAASGEKPGLACVCQLIFKLEVVTGDTGREEKKSGWFQENSVEDHVRLHCSQKPHGWFTSQVRVC